MFYKSAHLKASSKLANSYYEKSDDIIKNKFAELLDKTDATVNKKIVERAANKQYKFREKVRLYSFKSVGKKETFRQNNDRAFFVGGIAFGLAAAYVVATYYIALNPQLSNNKA